MRVFALLYADREALTWMAPCDGKIVWSNIQFHSQSNDSFFLAIGKDYTIADRSTDDSFTFNKQGFQNSMQGASEPTDDKIFSHYSAKVQHLKAGDHINFVMSSDVNGYGLYEMEFYPTHGSWIEFEVTLDDILTGWQMNFPQDMLLDELEHIFGWNESSETGLMMLTVTIRDRELLTTNPATVTMGSDYDGVADGPERLFLETDRSRFVHEIGINANAGAIREYDFPRGLKIEAGDKIGLAMLAKFGTLTLDDNIYKVIFKGRVVNRTKIQRGYWFEGSDHINVGDDEL